MVKINDCKYNKLIHEYLCDKDKLEDIDRKMKEAYDEFKAYKASCLLKRQEWLSANNEK